MSLRDEVKKIIADMDAATNKIAAKIDALTAKLAGGVSEEDAAGIIADLNAESAKLKSLGADAADPVPAAIMDPDGMKDKTVDPSSDDNGVQETTPILDKQ